MDRNRMGSERTGGEIETKRQRGEKSERLRGREKEKEIGSYGEDRVRDKRVQRRKENLTDTETERDLEAEKGRNRDRVRQ